MRIPMDRIPFLTVGGLAASAGDYPKDVPGDLGRLRLVEPTRVIRARREDGSQGHGAVDISVLRLRTAVLEAIQGPHVRRLRISGIGTGIEVPLRHGYHWWGRMERVRRRRLVHLRWIDQPHIVLEDPSHILALRPYAEVARPIAVAPQRHRRAR